MPRPGRLVGLDVARCLALLGMVATHVLDARTSTGDLTLAQSLAGGRASALFAVLAGVSLALMTGRETPFRGRARAAASAGLAVRAVLIAGLGLLLGGLDSGLAVILTYYGVLFLLGLPFVGLRARWLLVCAGVWAVAAPVASQAVRPHLPERQFASPAPDQLANPEMLVSELLFTGYYPAVPWLVYLLVGMGLGRLALSQRPVQARVAGVGIAVAVGAAAISRVLTASVGFSPDLLDEISTGMFGTTPTGGPWRWLLVVAPHSATPFDLAQTAGSALLVIGGCLLLVGLLPTAAERMTAVIFGAGTMTLTLYSLHVVMRTEAVWPPEEPGVYLSHVLVLLAIGALFVAVGRRGPLEWLVGLASAAVARPLRQLER